MVSGVPCVQFRPKISGDNDYIDIVDGVGCSSYVSNLLKLLLIHLLMRLYRSRLAELEDHKHSRCKLLVLVASKME